MHVKSLSISKAAPGALRVRSLNLARAWRQNADRLKAADSLYHGVAQLIAHSVIGSCMRQSSESVPIAAEFKSR